MTFGFSEVWKWISNHHKGQTGTKSKPCQLHPPLSLKRPVNLHFLTGLRISKSYWS